MLKKLLSSLVFTNLLFLNGCGAIFYPERHGNTRDVDPKVAVLDAVGLIFFLIPGVVAYAVDFTTGCIYLSGGGSHHAEIIPLDKSHNVNYQINNALYKNYGEMADNAVNMNGVIGFNNWAKLNGMNYF
jgi:hypothetical protein